MPLVTHKEPTAECCICLNDIELQPSKQQGKFVYQSEDPLLCQNACGHIFHEICLRHWYEQAQYNSELCPKCFKEIVVIKPRIWRTAQKEVKLFIWLCLKSCLFVVKNPPLNTLAVCAFYSLAQFLKRQFVPSQHVMQERSWTMSPTATALSVACFIVYVVYFDSSHQAITS